MSIEGLQTPGVAQRLGISRSTVTTHLAHVRAKLHVRSIQQAMIVAFNAGWIHPSRTRVGDPDRYSEGKLTAAAQVYLAAFDRHLAARDDPRLLADAKRRTDAALVALEHSSSSDASRDWLDGLVDRLAR